MKRFLLGVLLIGYACAAPKTIEIEVEGMTCPLCTMTIKKNLKKQSGVLKAKVKLNTNTATVTYEDDNISQEKLLKAIEEVGYKGRIKPRVRSTQHLGNIK
jgi:mercuric ion binding protein